MATSKTQLDRLGDRLKADRLTEADLQLLDEYRRSVGEAYSSVIETARRELRADLTGRPAKSTASIVAKLRRETTRLSQIQDIAGCRIVVTDTIAQDLVVQRLTDVFDVTNVVDRRAKPSYGYRAIHVVVTVEHQVEIQVRSLLQQKWAEVSEKCFDVIDSALKYGGGDEVFKRGLERLSDEVAEVESLDSVLLEADGEAEMLALQSHLDSIRAQVSARLDYFIERVSRFESLRKDGR